VIDPEAYLNQDEAMKEIIDHSPPPPAAYTGSRLFHELHNFLTHCNEWEIGLVRRVVRKSQTPCLRNTSLLVNRLGDGWLYVLIALSLLAFQGLHSWHVLLSAGVAAAMAHSIYPVIKNRVARVRPCDYDPSLNLSIRVLDKYSCPSGHIMTATAVAIPLATGLPHLLPFAIVICLVIGWARISLGHHYPSDLALGALLGSSTAFPVSLLLN
jgi:undecaprenyl-diphosphatase